MAIPPPWQGEGNLFNLTPLLPNPYQGKVDYSLTTPENAQISILVRLFLKLRLPARATSFGISFCLFQPPLARVERRRFEDLVRSVTLKFPLKITPRVLDKLLAMLYSY